MVSSTWKPTANEEGSPGQGCGCSSRHSCSAQIHLRDSQVAQLCGQLVRPAEKEGGNEGPGKQASLNERIPPTTQGRRACPGFLPSVATNLQVHLAINPSILGLSDHRQTIRGEMVFYFAQLIFLHSMSAVGRDNLMLTFLHISWHLAVLRDCPQSPL